MLWGVPILVPEAFGDEGPDGTCSSENSALGGDEGTFLFPKIDENIAVAAVDNTVALICMLGPVVGLVIGTVGLSCKRLLLSWLLCDCAAHKQAKKRKSTNNAVFGDFLNE